MRIIEINGCNFGSTGNIMFGIAATARKHGHDVMVCVPKSGDNSKKKVQDQLFIGNRVSRIIHLKLGKLTGYQDCFSIFSTMVFLNKLFRLSPDIIHLHNLHNCYINLGMLFRWIKRRNIPVVWTLHDCWSFTGHCPHFTMAKCEKWKTGCYDCPIYKDYPQSDVDNSKWMWKLKKRWFTGVENMTIVTPSQWLADLVKQSYLKDYPVKVINNGIDLSIFKPTASDFREKHGIPTNKPILLGVAFGWGERKGLDVFVKLAEDFGDTYQIVLVGTDDRTDAQLPASILSIHRTQDQHELAEIYSAADAFVNPTREENFPTVNMEALACGTPVITFETGGSPEIPDETCGMVVPCDDVPALERAIRYVIANRPFTQEACLKRAQQFDMRDKFAEYMSLYQEVCEAKQ